MADVLSLEVESLVEDKNITDHEDSDEESESEILAGEGNIPDEALQEACMQFY